MKSKWTLSAQVFWSAFFVFSPGLQAPPVVLLHASSVLFPPFADTSASLKSSDVKGARIDQARVSKGSAVDSYGSLPLSLEANYGQTDSQVKFLSRGSRYNLYLTGKEAVMEFRAPTNRSSDPQCHSSNANLQSSTVRMKMVGANSAARIVALDELPGKSNYFVGKDRKKWRTGVPNYSRIRYEDAYPGVDVVFYGNQRQLEYDLIVAPGADFKAIGIEFEGARTLHVDDSGDLVIQTSVGEIRQRKPRAYQEASGIKRPVESGYVIRGGREVGFEIGHYDQSRAITIDPVLVYSTSVGGFYNDVASGVAVDAAGNAYFTGMTTSTDFPTVNPFQPNLGRSGAVFGIPTDAFVAKLNPSGTALVYSTYLGGGSNDAGNALAVDGAGNAYITGYTMSSDFPTTPDAFQTKVSSFGDAFIAKLNPTGNALTYSSRLGGSPGPTGFNFLANNGLGVAVDITGSAYVTGYTFSPSFPVRKAVQNKIDRGTNTCCFPECLYSAIPGPSPTEDAFVTKVNPSGTGLVYSTYVGGTGQEEGYAIALGPSGSAYITGRTCSRDFASGGYGGGRSDAFIVRLSASGREFISSRFLGGDGDDVGTAIAVDSAGNAYVAGQTDSPNFPTSQFAFQPNLAGSVSYVTADGGNAWSAASGLPNSPVNVLAIDPTNPQTVYAGLGDCFKSAGVFKSTDGGNTFRSSGLVHQIIQAIAVDPKQSSTVYAGISKSTDAGATWTTMTFPGPNPPFGAATIAIDPINTATIYLLPSEITCSDFEIPPVLFKSIDSGATWKVIPNGPNPSFVTSLAIDPKNPSTLYATDFNINKSTDGGNTWRVQWEELHYAVLLAIDPTNTSTLYIQQYSSPLLKSTDGGTTFRALESPGFSINYLVIDPTNSSVLYAAADKSGNGGGVFKSTDAGQTWVLTDLSGMTVNALAINTLNSSQIHAGAVADIDAFAAFVNPAGGVQSSYLGSRAHDFAAGIGIDASGNFYITGRTFSDSFPTKDALLNSKTSGPFATAAFVTKLRPGLDSLAYSTYLAADEPSFGTSIAVDATGKAYVAGTRGAFRTVPTASSIESIHGGADAFVSKIITAPRVNNAEIVGKNIVVIGEGFERGAVVLVNGTDQRTRNDEALPTKTLIARKAGKNIAPGEKVAIQVRNADGLVSEPFSLTR